MYQVRGEDCRLAEAATVAITAVIPFSMPVQGCLQESRRWRHGDPAHLNMHIPHRATVI